MKCRSKFGSRVTGRCVLVCNEDMDSSARSRALLLDSGYSEIELFQGARLAVEGAGKLIRETVRSRGLANIQASREEKGDGSPVSLIDRLAHDFLEQTLTALVKFPVVSEEDPHGPLEIEKIANDEFFWIADPLDGTRDFLAGEKTFAVSLALMRKLDKEESELTGSQAHPYLGLIHDPSGEQTWGAVRFGSIKKWIKGEEANLPDAKRRTEGELRVLGSRSIPSSRMQELYRFWGAETVVRMGSAMKFALIAEGSYDVYPRFGPTSEWDTAAGQVLLEVSGGGLVPISLPVRAMPYGKSDWLNPGFLAAGSQELLTKWIPILVQKLR